ncbi:type II 3-dehydroquinate dehydratase [Candidatus Vidania fulgoroideorum]
MKILIINGSNINMLGIREIKKYGKESLKYIENILNKKFSNLFFFQSNYEGDIINKIHSLYKKIDWIIINPAGFSYNSYSIIDAIKSINVKFAEIHITNIFSRKNRKNSLFSKYSNFFISGMGYFGYIFAVYYINKIGNL